MVQIPLGFTAYTHSLSEQPATVHRNFLAQKDVSGGAQTPMMHVQRPGLTVYQTLPLAGGVRGLGYAQGLFSNKAVGVIFDTIYSFDGSGTSVLGTVANDGKSVQFAFTNFGVAVLSGGSLYFYRTTDNTFHAVGIPSAKTPVSITSIDSYVIIGCSDGTWYWLVPGDITIDPTHFATAESMPDNLIAVFQLHDEVFMFGASSIEPWGMTGQADLIMEPSPGRRIDHGLLYRDTLQSLDNTAYFVADDAQVMRFTNGEPERISTAGLEERIGLRTSALSAVAFQYQGHSLYVLTIPGQGTFAFDVLTSTWSEFLSPQLTTGWLPSCVVMLADKVLAGSSTSGKVFLLANVSTDDGTVFERAVSGIVAFSGGWHRNDSIEVWAGASADAALRIRWHDGNATSYGSYVTRTLRAPQNIVRFTQLGGAYPPFRIVEISTVDPAVVRISQAEANSGRAA